MAKLINNYIIGLGGAGGSSVAAFRRALALRSHEAKQMAKRGVRFAYLYIDSNDKDIDKAQSPGGKWSVPGTDVHLESGECLQIDGNGFTMEQARMLGNIKPWFGNTRNVSVLNLQQNIEGAGQRRRYGRMLLARKASELTSRLTVGKSNLLEGSKDVRSITYHIFATLGGGTGSGSIVDLVTYLYQSSTSGNSNHPAPEIFLYLYVGGDADEVKAAAVNTNSLFLNEYSALKDLNALQTKGYMPELAADPHTNQIFISKAAPIKAIYLSSEDSDHRYKLPDQIEQMANGCLDIISLYHSDNVSSEEGRPFTGEDLLDGQSGEISKEGEWDSCAQVEPGKGINCQRAYHFQALAISRCKEPVREVQTVLKSVMAQEVIDRLLRGERKDRETRERTAEGNPHIFSKRMKLLSVRLSEALAKYRQEKLNAFTEKYKSENIEFGPDTLRQLNEDLAVLKDTIRRDTYRESQSTIVAGGIQNMCIEEAKEQTLEISKRLKQQRVWESRQPDNPIWGIEDISQYLTDLIRNLEHEISSEFSFTATNGNLEKREEEWGKICGLTNLFPKQEKMYDVHYTEALAVLNRCFAERKQCIYRLVWKEMCKTLNALRERVKILIEKHKTEEERQRKMEIMYRKKIENSEDAKGVVYIYDQDHLNKHADFYHADPQSDERIANIMAALEKEETSGVLLPLEKSLPDVVILDKDREGKTSFWSLSQEVHDWLIKDYSTQYKPAYHKNIFEALQDRNHADENASDEYLKKLKTHLKPMAGIDASPLGGNGLTSNFLLPPYKAIMVGAPAVDSDKEYTEDITQSMAAMFAPYASDASRFKTYILNDQHEIRVMLVNYWMPVRYFSFMRHLHKTYCEKPEGVDMVTNLYYSNIDDKDEQKPLLVPENVSPFAHQARLYFELGKYLPVHAEAASYMVTREIERRDGSVIYQVHRLADDKKKTLVDTIDYVDYSEFDMKHGNPAFVQHLTQATQAWFSVKHADPQAILEQLRLQQLKAAEQSSSPDGAQSVEARRLSAMHEEFRQLMKDF